MKPPFTTAPLVASCACLGLVACGLFGPKDSAPDAGAKPGASSAPAVVGMSFASGTPFEGEIAVSVRRPGKPQGVAFYDVKGPKVRVRSTPAVGDTTFVIVDTTTWDVASVSDSARTVTRLNLATTFAGVPKKKAVAAGKVDVVAGYLCDLYRVDGDDGDKIEACMARGVRFPALDPADNPWLAELGAEAFPMRVVVADSSGRPKSVTEVTQVQPTELPETLFTVPPGYKSVDVATLVKGERDR